MSKVCDGQADLALPRKSNIQACGSNEYWRDPTFYLDEFACHGPNPRFWPIACVVFTLVIALSTIVQICCASKRSGEKSTNDRLEFAKPAVQIYPFF